MEFEVKITSGARKHGISRSRIVEVLASPSFTATLPLTGSDPKVLYVGADDRGPRSRSSP